MKKQEREVARQSNLKKGDRAMNTYIITASNGETYRVERSTFWDAVAAWKSTYPGEEIQSITLEDPPPHVDMRVPSWADPADNAVAGEDGWASEIVDKASGIEMILVHSGTFQMGSPETEQGRDEDEGPQHTVLIERPFYLGKYTVTQAQWQHVMGNNPSRFQDPRNPVEQVSWNDCQEFAKKTGLRLPTEQEWEYAARAGTTTPFHFGETISTDQANYDGNYTYGKGVRGEYRQKTTPVGSFAPNAWGFYDMHGNVWEWCEDIYVKDAYARRAAAKA